MGTLVAAMAQPQPEQIYPSPPPYVKLYHPDRPLGVPPLPPRPPKSGKYAVFGREYKAVSQIQGSAMGPWLMALRAGVLSSSLL